MKRAALVALALLAVASPVTAQSLFNSAGIGLPVETLDARSRALGNVGVGLMGGALRPTDPAAAARLVTPTAQFTAQPSWVEYRRDETGESGTIRGARFPMVGLAYPAWDYGLVSLTFGSFLDQRYEARREETVNLKEGPLSVSDEFVSDGGVSTIQLGFARTVGEVVSVGVSAGRYSGNVVRRITRTFEGEGSGAEGAEPFGIGGRWGYSGTALSLGASLEVGSVARVAASVSRGGTLEAEASDDTEGADGSFDLPTRLRIGGSAVLAPGLMASLGFTVADWSATADDLRSATTAGQTKSFGAGLELTRARLLGRRAPLRIGYRRTELPFVFSEGTPVESVFSAGLGLALQESGEFTLAGVDVAVERGNRADDGLSEDFWRATLTLRVSGF